MILKKKKAEPKPDPIWGFTDPDEFDFQPTTPPKKQQKRRLPAHCTYPKIRTIKRHVDKPIKQKTRIIPDLNINYETATLPPVLKNIDPAQLRGVVNVPEKVLLDLRKEGESRAKAYTNFLFKAIMPTVMAFDAGNKYFQTALLDGMGIDLEIDPSTEDALQNLLHLDIITFYLKRCKLPTRYKRQYLTRLVQMMAEASVRKMEGSDKKRNAERSIKELEGVVVRGLSKEVDRKLQEQQSNRREQMAKLRMEQAVKPATLRRKSF